MAAIISRRLRLNSTLLKSSSSFIFPPTFSHSKTPSSNSFPKPPPQTNSRSFYQFIPNSSLSRPIFFSTNDSPPPPPPSSDSDSDSIFKHEEIEGPTVERDLSSLDNNKIRELIEGMMKYTDKINTIVALLSLIPLGLGAFITYVILFYPITEVSVQSVMAVAFPFSVVSFMLRRASMPICVIKKMEKQGRFHIHIHVGSRGISFASVAAISAGFVFYIMILKFINSAS